MNKSCSLLCASAVAFAATCHASAGITGLYAESVASNTLTNTTLLGTTYRIYLQFDNPADTFVSALETDIDFAGTLYQDNDFGTNFGPHSPASDGIVADLAADSYVAVNGGSPSGDGTWRTADFVNGSGITGGWFAAPPTDPVNQQDVNGRVLVMFLTFEGAGLPSVSGMITTQLADGTFSSTVLGDLMLGSIIFSFNPNGAVAGGISGVTVLFDPLPAPGAMALLVACGLVGKRRRRA